MLPAMRGGPCGRPATLKATRLVPRQLTNLLTYQLTNVQAEHEELQDRMDELLSLFRSLATPPPVALPAPQPLQLEQLEQLHQLRASLDSGLTAVNQRIDAMDLAHLVQVQAQAQMGAMATAGAPAPGSLNDDGAGGALPRAGGAAAGGAAATPASPAAACPWREKASGRCAASPPQMPMCGKGTDGKRTVRLTPLEPRDQRLTPY